MKTFAIIVTACFSVLATGCGMLGGSGEYGDNDSRFGAFEIELEERYESRIRRSSDQEYFKFTTAHDGETYDLIEVDVEVESSDLFVKVEVFDTRGIKVSEENASAGGQSVRHEVATLGGTFYVRFSGWDPERERGTSGRYAFTVSNLFANDDYAGNHSLRDAQEIELDVVYEGVLVSELEADFYAFSTAHDAGTFDEIEIDITVDETDLVVRLELLDPLGNIIHHTRAPDAGESLRHTFVTTGASFVVRISGWGLEDNRDHGSSGPYALRISNSFSNDEFAGNHSLDDAFDIELDTIYEGALVAEEEADYFRFASAHTGAEYDTVVIEVEAHDPDLMMHIELYDDRGNLSNLFATASAPGENVALGYVSPGGMRHVRFSGWDPVGDRDHGSTGEYSFRVRNLDNNDPFMGNHRFEHAHPIEVGVSYDAVLLCIYETDWFVVDGAERNATYTVTADPSGTLALRVEIYDSTGGRFESFTPSSHGGEVMATFQSPDDEFTIRFSGWNTAWNQDHGSRGPYSFRVDRN